MGDGVRLADAKPDPLALTVGLEVSYPAGGEGNRGPKSSSGESITGLPGWYIISPLTASEADPLDSSKELQEPLNCDLGGMYSPSPSSAD